MSYEPLPVEVRHALPYRDAADYAGVSVTSIRRAIEGGYLIRSVPPGQTKPVVLRESLDRWLESGRDA